MEHPTIGTPVLILCRTENLRASGIEFLHQKQREIAKEYIWKGCKIPELNFYSLIEFLETYRDIQEQEHILVLLDPTSTTRSKCDCHEKPRLLCVCGMNTYNIYPNTKLLEDMKENPLCKIDKRDIIIPLWTRLRNDRYTCFDIETYS